MKRRDYHLEENPHWRGGRYLNDAGYVMVYKPGHRRSMANGYVREHILIAEKALGKELPPDAQVHHYGEIGDNSKIMICQDQEYHRLIHSRQRAMADCGDADKRKCKFCREYDSIENLFAKPYRNKKGQLGGWNIYHRKCENKYDRERRAKYGTTSIPV